MAISVVVAVGNAADRLVPLVQERIAQAQGRRRPRERQRDGPARSTRRTATRSPATSTRRVAEGATLVADGRALAVSGRENGFFLGPCLFDNVKPDMSIYKDEIFGPVLSA